MNLTSSEKATLKTDIAANTNTIPAGQTWTGSFAGQQVKNLPNTSDGNIAIAGWYNLTASPAFRVWRTSVQPSEYKGANGLIWTEVDALTVGKSRIFEWMTGGLTLPFNPSDSNQRTGLGNAFSGTSSTNLTALSKRDSTRAEKLLATGTGSDASPATMSATAEGLLTAAEVEAARNLP